MRSASPLKTGAARRLSEAHAALVVQHGTPEKELGNKPNPLDEAIYIILSFQTDLSRLTSVWAQLRAAYPSWEALECASHREVERVLRAGGLQKQKARTIKRLLTEVRAIAGTLSLDFLRDMDDADAERVLVRLPGISWKAARCILLYSLDRAVLPIDSNTFRILRRTGVLSPRAVYRRKVLHDAIQSAVPSERRRTLHVNLVVHGQRICLPRNPHCERCPLSAVCPKVGMRDNGSRQKRQNSVRVRYASGRGRQANPGMLATNS